MASAVLTVEDVCEEYVVASSNPLDAEYLFHFAIPILSQSHQMLLYLNG